MSNSPMSTTNIIFLLFYEVFVLRMMIKSSMIWYVCAVCIVVCTEGANELRFMTKIIHNNNPVSFTGVDKSLTTFWGFFFQPVTWLW